MTVSRGSLNSLQIRLDDSSLDKFKSSLPQKAIERAAKRAADETAQWLSTRLVKQLSENMGIKQSVLRPRVRRSSAGQDPKGGRGAAYVWVGLFKIKPKEVGKLENYSTGAFGGEFFFEGGFVARMRSGHVGIFKRREKKRLKIDEQYIEIDQVADEIIERLLPRAENELQRKLEQKIQFEMEKLVAKT